MHGSPTRRRFPAWRETAGAGRGPRARRPGKKSARAMKGPRFGPRGLTQGDAAHPGAALTGLPIGKVPAALPQTNARSTWSSCARTRSFLRLWNDTGTSIPIRGSDSRRQVAVTPVTRRPALSRAGRMSPALRAALRRCAGAGFSGMPCEEEDHQRDDEEVDHPSGEISVLDRVLPESVICALRHRRRKDEPDHRISTSSTMPDTTFPMAAPMMTPIASANAFCLSRNSRNPSWSRSCRHIAHGGSRASRGCRRRLHVIPARHGSPQSRSSFHSSMKPRTSGRCSTSSSASWPGSGRSHEVICVDDGSRDGTFQELSRLAPSIPSCASSASASLRSGPRR